MATDKERLIEAIQSADQFAFSLEALQGEIVSYQTAKKELAKVSQALTVFQKMDKR